MEVYLKNDILDRLNRQSIHLFFDAIQQNESLTSWICRNALSNYLAPTDFVGEWLNKHKARHHDFDLNPVEDLIQWIIWMSPRRQDLKHGSKIIQLENTFSHRKTKLSPFIPEGTIHQKRLYPIQFCPSCLRSKNPYFKLDWKVNLIYGCDLCKCYLASKCSYCSNPHQLMKIELMRQNERFSKVSDCSFCNVPLSQTKVNRLEEQELNTLSWIKKIIGLTHQPSPVKASLLIDLSALLCSSSQVGLACREYFNIIQLSSNCFYLLEPKEKANLIYIVMVWIDNFYVITTEINQQHSISRRYWSQFINFPDGTLNP